jgi:hypothetical protein
MIFLRFPSSPGVKMPRSDRFGDDDSFESPPPKSSSGVILIVLLAGLVLVVVVPMVLLVGWLFMAREATVQRAQQADMEARDAAVAEREVMPVPRVVADRPMPVQSRKDFDARVKNKSKDEIIAAVGRPDEEIGPPAGLAAPGAPALTWFYHNRVRSDDGELYASVAVWLNREGVAYRIEYPQGAN